MPPATVDSEIFLLILFLIVLVLMLTVVLLVIGLLILVLIGIVTVLMTFVMVVVLIVHSISPVINYLSKNTCRCLFRQCTENAVPYYFAQNNCGYT